MVYRRPAWVEVDTGAITRNVRTLKSLTAPGTLFMAVVKADGYGHGALESSKAALAGGADRLGVATLEEALELRESGTRVPIHILGLVPASAAPAIVDNDIIATVGDREFAVELSRAAMSAGRQVKYHLKIDTGMNRIGVRAEEAAETAAWLRNMPGLVFEGAFTHFATADEPGDWEYDQQVERLADAIGSLKTEGVRPPVLHAANSAATILHPDTHLDMVRCGIAIYGLHPSKATYGRVELEPAMSVKTQVSFVKTIGLGAGVSYGFTWHADGPTVIATLPLGYADGIHRTLSDRMEVLIGGRKCRQVGRVCMDQFMVALPPGARASTGDEAVIVGRQAGQSISMDDMADAAGTINYEIACDFALRMRRDYRTT